MPKNTFPIMLEVEEIALGTVLRKLHDMPGIAKLDLNLGQGGHGPGRKQLEQASIAQSSKGETAEQRTVKLLMNGAMHISEISRQLGGAKSRSYGAMHQLKKKHIVEPMGKGMWQLTHKARTQLGAVKALPAPSAIKVKHGPSGRASPGSGPIILRAALDAGPLSSGDLRAKLVDGGMSPKGISGVLDRARRGGLVKRNGNKLFELTAKGQKIEMGAPAHG